MARLIYSKRVLADLDRLSDFLMESDPVAAGDTVELIAEAVQVLRNHPLIGRAAEDRGTRELLISRGRSGYVLLYSVEAEGDVLLLAIRHQREAAFWRKPN